MALGTEIFNSTETEFLSSSKLSAKCSTQTTETVDYSQATPTWQSEHKVMSRK